MERLWEVEVVVHQKLYAETSQEAERKAFDTVEAALRGGTPVTLQVIYSQVVVT